MIKSHDTALQVKLLKIWKFLHQQFDILNFHCSEVEVRRHQGPGQAALAAQTAETLRQNVDRGRGGPTFGTIID